MSANIRYGMLRTTSRWGARIMLAVAGFFLASAGAALAYFTVSLIYNTHDAVAQATSLVAPTNPTATVGGSGEITVGWNANAQPSGAVVQYEVTRTSPGTSQTVCTVPANVSSCDDTGLTASTTYNYSIIAVLDSWRSTATTTSATTETPSYVITLSSGPYTAGSSITVQKITAQVGGQTDTTYTGAKTINWTGLTTSPSGNAPTYPSSSVTFASGVATPGSTFTSYVADVNQLDAVDSGAPTVQGSVSFTVTPASENKLAITTQPATSITAGGTVSVGVTVEDQFGNPITTGNTGSTDTISVALNSGTFAAGTTSVTASNGIANFSGLQINTAGTYTITASDSTHPAVSSATTNSFTVSAGPLHGFTVSNPGTETAGGAFNVTVTAVDSFGNTVTSYSGTHILSWSGPSASPNGTAPSYPTSATSVSFSGGVGAATGIVLYNATASQTLTASASSPTLTGTSSSFAVNSATANLSFSSSPPTLSAHGATWTSTVKIGNDAYGNAPLFGGSGITITLSLASGQHFSVTAGSTGNANPQTSATITATGTPSGSFTVEHIDSANNKTDTLTASAPGFTSANINVSS